eukprot:5577933-Pleurochrysis_carterae.AAC.1
MSDAGGESSGGARLKVEEGALSLAHSARPVPSVENATSAPPSLNSAFSADSFSSGGADSAVATRAALAVAF